MRGHRDAFGIVEVREDEALAPQRAAVTRLSRRLTRLTQNTRSCSWHVTTVNIDSLPLTTPDFVGPSSVISLPLLEPPYYEKKFTPMACGIALLF